MSVSTLSNFIAAVNGTTGKSGATYFVTTGYADGDVTINRTLNGVTSIFAHIFFSTQPDNGVVTDANPNGTQVLIKTYVNAGVGAGTGTSDSLRYCAAQAFVNMLAAN